MPSTRKSSVFCAAVLLPLLGVALTGAIAACSSDPDPVADAGKADATAADTGTKEDSSATPDAASPDDATTEAAADAGPKQDTGPDAVADAGSDGSCAPYTGALPGDAGAKCHDLVNSAPAIPLTPDNGTLPVGTGGKLGDGLYHMTEVRTYPGSPLSDAGITIKITILIVGDTAYTVNDNSNEATTVRKITKGNPDGGADIVLCTTKVENGLKETSSTATCNSFMTYDTNVKFSTKLQRQ